MFSSVAWCFERLKKMAIRIIEGSIGSGKTYYAVWHILTNYFKWDISTDNYLPKNSEKPVLVYSNIEKFLLSDSLDERIKDAGGLDKFFHADYQKEFCRDRKIIYLIDEAQGPFYFHRKFYNPSVFYFFQYHRHFGCDIYLITQDTDTLSKELRNLAEYHIKALRRTFSFLGEFKYFFSTGGYDPEVFKKKTLKPKKEIFSLYSSMSQEEVEKLPSASRRYVVMVVLFFVLAGIIFKFGFLSLMFSSAEAKIKGSVVVSSPVLPPSSLPVSSPVSPALVNNKLKTYDDYMLEIKNKMSNNLPVNSDVPVGKVRYNVLGYISVPKDNSADSEADSSNSYFLYEDIDGRVKRIRAFDFDVICKCNSLGSIRAGVYDF